MGLQVIKSIRRLPWNKPEEQIQFHVVKAVLKVARTKYVSLPNVADCLSGLSKHCPNLIIEVKLLFIKIWRKYLLYNCIISLFFEMTLFNKFSLNLFVEFIICCSFLKFFLYTIIFYLLQDCRSHSGRGAARTGLALQEGDSALAGSSAAYQRDVQLRSSFVGPHFRPALSSHQLRTRNAPFHRSQLYILRIISA